MRFLFFGGTLGILFWASIAMASSASFYYSDGPWMGRVIDAETKEPIEGAVVLAVWNKVYASPTGRHHYFFEAKEVLTDKNGLFVIQKLKTINFLPIISTIEGPEFVIFKPGYTSFPGPAYNYFHNYFPYSPLRVDLITLGELFKKNITIELLKLKNKEERLKVLPSINAPFTGNREKKKNLIKLINAERVYLGLDPETGE